MNKWIIVVTMVAFAAHVQAKNVTIEIATDEADCPIAVEPDDPCTEGSEDICLTKGNPHKITWKYKGSMGSKPDFEIEMKSADDHDTIFVDGCRNSGKSISCKISDAAPEGDYDYSVVNSVCTHDPRIIITR